MNKSDSALENSPEKSRMSGSGRNDDRSLSDGSLDPEPADSGEDFLDEDSFGEMMMEMVEESLENIQEGNIIEGEIVEIEPDYVLVDIGYKSEGLVPRSEFTDEEGNLRAELGDRVEVLLLDRDYEGQPLLSREEAKKSKVWNALEQSREDEESVTGTIVRRVKGGYTVDIGLEAFLPASHLDVRPVRNPDEWIATEHKFKILKMNKRRRNVVVSRRAQVEEENQALREQTLQDLQVGAEMEGTVRNITDYGLFVDLGGLVGLVHISDISWGRIAHPSKRYDIGDTVRVRVLDFDPESEKVSLGIKQLSEDPWNRVEETYPVGARVRGRVVNLKKYGAFVELEDGVVGMVHVSDMTWTGNVSHPSHVLNKDDEVECQVLSIDTQKREIALGLKQLEPNPWDTLAERFPPGTVIEGTVKKVTDFGIFIGIADGINGLVHVTDMAWTGTVKNPAEHYQKGQTVRAMILEVDRRNQRVSLGIKQVTPDPWEELPNRYPPGTEIAGTVSGTAEFGVFVEIEKGIEGLVHVSELAEDRPEVSDYTPGERVSARVIEVVAAEKRIRLTMRSVSPQEALPESERHVPVSDLGRQLEEKWGRKHSEEKAVEKKRPAGTEDADADRGSGESPER